MLFKASLANFRFKRSSRGQVSMEYLMVVGLSFLLITPLAVLFVYQSNSMSSEIQAVQMERVGQEIISSAEEVFYLGSPTQKVLKVYFPERLSSVTVESQAVVFNMTVGDSTLSYPAYSELSLNMSGSIGNYPGPHILLIKSEENTVNIAELK